MENHTQALGGRPSKSTFTYTAVSDTLLDEHKHLHPKSQHRSNTRKLYAWLKFWWTEATAGILLLASILASLLTLYPYQGKPLVDWHHPISIGALLSIYSVVFRSSASYLIANGLSLLKWRWFKSSNWRPLTDMVTHDEAISGPMGATKMLWKMRVPIKWQSIGCVLALVALVTGPFIQQVLQFVPCKVLNDTPGSVPSISRTSVVLGLGRSEAPGINTLTSAEQAALTNWISSPPAIGTTCNSGNCTFEPYSSAGYCASCTDISSEVQFDISNTGVGPGADGFTSWHGQNFTAVSALPDGGINMTYQYDGIRGGPQLSNFAVSGGDLGGLSVLIGLPGLPFDPSTGGSVAGCITSATSGTWRCKGYGAATCVVKPCVRTYRAQVMNGDFTETIIDTTMLPDGGSGHWFGGPAVQSMLNKTCLLDAEKDALRQLQYPVDDSGTWMAYNLSMASNTTACCPQVPFDFATLERGFIDRKCLYAASTLMTSGIAYFLQEAFAGELVGRTASRTSQINALVGSQFLSTIYNYGNFSFERIQDVLDNMTIALTNELRYNSGIDDGPMTLNGKSFDVGGLKSPTYGASYINETCIRLSWSWFILPAFLAATTLVFIVGVLLSCQNLSYDVLSWKTSSLPVAFDGPFTTHSHGEEPSRGSQDIDALMAVGEKMKTKLVRDASGRSTFTRLVE